MLLMKKYKERSKEWMTHKIKDRIFTSGENDEAHTVGSALSVDASSFGIAWREHACCRDFRHRCRIDIESNIEGAVALFVSQRERLQYVPIVPHFERISQHVERAFRLCSAQLCSRSRRRRRRWVVVTIAVAIHRHHCRAVGAVRVVRLNCRRIGGWFRSRR